MSHVMDLVSLFTMAAKKLNHICGPRFPVPWTLSWAVCTNLTPGCSQLPFSHFSSDSISLPYYFFFFFVLNLFTPELSVSSWGIEGDGHFRNTDMRVTGCLWELLGPAKSVWSRNMQRLQVGTGQLLGTILGDALGLWDPSGVSSPQHDLLSTILPGD